jgi:hypothetical protein
MKSGVLQEKFLQKIENVLIETNRFFGRRRRSPINPSESGATREIAKINLLTNLHDQQ